MSEFPSGCPDGGEVLGPTVNGLCPAGYTAQGSVCCSSIAAALCPDGNAPLTAVNLQCPNPLTQTYNATVGGCCTNIGSNAFVSYFRIKHSRLYKDIRYQKQCQLRSGFLSRPYILVGTMRQLALPQRRLRLRYRPQRVLPTGTSLVIYIVQK